MELGHKNDSNPSPVVDSGKKTTNDRFLKMFFKRGAWGT
jgi:hypothetical protein